MRKTLIVAGLVGALSSAMPVQTRGEGKALPEQEPESRTLQEVLVTAPAKTRVELLPLDVTVLSDSVIVHSTESSLLPVLTDRVAGLFTSERGFAGYGVSGGAAGTVNIRGVGQGNKVLFMIDGQPQWASVFGHALPDTYVANGIERVEVVKGPSSLLYGSNAMGGSVNIITRKATRDGLYGRARAMFGSFNTQKFNLASGYRHERFSVAAAGQLDRSNGNRSGSAFWLANEMVNLGYELSGNWSAGATVTMTQTHADNPGTLQSPLEDMWTYMGRGTASVFAHDHYAWGEGGVQAYVNWGRHNVDDGHAPGAEARDYLFHSNDYNMGLTAYQTMHFWQASDLSVGVDYVHWGGHTWNTLKDAAKTKEEGIRKCVNDIAGYVMMQQGFFSGILDVNAGIRLQHSGQFGNEWVPQAGAIVRPLEGSMIKFSWGKGFRAPNIRELYMYPPHNPDLRPERLYNYEVELRQTLLGGRLDMGLALYYIDGSDMIQTARVDGKPLNVNTGSFINKGFEVDAAWRIDRRWQLAANYAYLHTNNATVLYAPKNKLWGEVSFQPGAWTLAASVNSIWSLETGGPEKSDYALVNLRGAYTAYKGDVRVQPFLKLDNIGDKHYEVVYGCPMPGISILGGVEVSF